MAGISSKTVGKLENKERFNDGTELNSTFDINYYETSFRNYDPQIGRFHQIDPLADDFDDWSPYAFAYNNPIYWNDPLGLENMTWEDILKQVEDGTIKPGLYYHTSDGNTFDYSPASFHFDKQNRKVDVRTDPTYTTTDHTDESGVTWTEGAYSTGRHFSIDVSDKYMPYDESGWDYVPVVGSALKGTDEFKKGRWGWGIFYYAMAVSDAFAVKAAATTIAKASITSASRYLLKKAVVNPRLTTREALRMSLTKSPGVASMMRGKGIERAFREMAGNNVVLKIAMRLKLLGINPSNRGADLIGESLLKGTWWDITTAGQWEAHVEKYGEGGIKLLYK